MPDYRPVSPGDPAQIIAMDGEALGRQELDSDVRLHIEMLPGKHQLEVENPQAPARTTQRVQFIAEPGRTYRVVLADRAWHAQKSEPTPAGTWSPLVYELDDQLQPVNKYYLGDQEAAMRKAAAVANQAKAR